MVEKLKEYLRDITKIELIGDSDPFVIYRGKHPQPGPEGYPWENSQEELVENRISVFEGLNRLNSPDSVWYDHYILAETSYEKICDLLLFFDFGLDKYINPDTGELMNSNTPEKMRQRRDAAAHFLRLFKRESISILSLTSEHLIFVLKNTDSKESHRRHLAESMWNHNKIYYPRPRSVTNSQEQYSLEHFKRLGAEHGVFSVGWDDT